MGSRAVVLVCRDADAAARPVRRADGEPAPSTPGPAGRSSTPTLTERAARPACAPRSTRPGCGTSSAPTGCCSTPSCCRGRPRPSELLARPVRRGRRGGPVGAARPRSTVLEQAAAPRASTSPTCWRGPGRARPTPSAFTDGLPALLLADRRARRRAARAVPGAGHARAHATTTATTAGTSTLADRLVAADPGLFTADPPARRRHDRPGGGGRRRPPGGRS